MADSLTLIKVGFIFVFLLEGFISGLAPVKLPACRNHASVLGIANAFAGGVFIAIALTHIFPEVSADWIEYNEHHHHDDGPYGHGDDESPWPMPFILIFVGYTFILIIDKVLFDTHALVDHDHEHEHEHEERTKSIVEIQGSSPTQYDVTHAVKEVLGKAERFTSKV